MENEPTCIAVYLTLAHEHDHERDVSLLAIDQYMREVRCMELLSPEEEAVLIERVKQGIIERRQLLPNQWRLQVADEARACLIERYQRLVVSIAKDYVAACPGSELTDLVNEGNIGLLLLFDKLDEYDTTEQPLVRIAVEYVRGYVLRAVESRDGVVRIPRWGRDQLKRLDQVHRRLFVALERNPNYQELAVDMGVSVEKVCELVEWRRCSRMVSVESLFDGMDDEMTPGESPEESLGLVSLFGGVAVHDGSRQVELVVAFRQAFESVLTPRQREVMLLRCGLGEATSEVCTQSELAARLGLSSSAVANHEWNAKKRLQVALAPYIEGAGVAA